MGLKQFHIVFITAAVILFLGTAYTLFTSEVLGGVLVYKYFAFCCLIIGLALAGYEVYYIQKSRGISNH